ncbi:hypothetical protein LCGC14_1372970 [marine sediment metagenome]|uniref:Glycosyltransferase subfamily 4-like N-terminal domain-containing protein n=1 Tax=marine sediment metagenome TaxID=412755 RepID=A0A0F9N6U9_9ZZZZ
MKVLKKVFVFGIRGFPFIGGGAERHSEELYPRLVKLGYDVTVLTRRLMFPQYKGVKFIKLPYIDNPFLETMSHSILCSIYCIFKRPDIVHIHNIGAFLFVPLFSLLNIKTVVTIHSFNYQHKKWGHFSRFVLNFLENLGISFAHKKIVVADNSVDFLRKKYCRILFLTCIPNGVNEADHVPAGLTLRKYKLKQRKYILAIGRIVPEKGFDKLIEAYKKIEDSDYKLVIVGNDIQKLKYSANLVIKERFNDNVVFTGFLCGKELAELYSNAGLFVSASDNEGFPLVILEALSYGLPVLASKIPAHEEIELPSSKYFDNEKELIDKIVYFMKNGTSDEEKEVYKNILKERHNWDAIAKRTSELYA